MNSFLLAFKSGFGFLSTIPVGITMEGIDELMKKIYFYPVVGAILGLLIGIVAYIGQLVFPDSVLAVLIMGFVYYITGFNHLDGVMDMGDGFMAHGSLEKKVKALKDTTLGTGGVAFGILVLLAFYASVRAVQAEGVNAFGFKLPLLMFGSMFIAEVSAKQSMLTIAAFGKPLPRPENQAYPGLGEMTINGASQKNFLIGFVFGAFVSYLPFGPIGLISYLAACVSSLVLLNRSYAHFGGLNGDGIGTANEIGRITALILIAVMLKLSLNEYLGGLEWTLL
ncbi:MAG: adenosylcobinamide-GDP ribazoletransferase [Euryarchaeota archaeon]|nr:adenosylcobinamide-GDP ribazoletransferase [Euryarchaeota archaeon]